MSILGKGTNQTIHCTDHKGYLQILSIVCGLESELEKDIAACREEINELQCPWPEDIWTMTDEEYMRAVPDEHLRTAISGFLMRKGWEFCIRQLKEGNR